MHAFRALTEPPGPSRPTPADRRAVPVDVALAGIHRAGTPLLWPVLDLVLALVAAGGGYLAARFLDLPAVPLAVAVGLLLLAWTAFDLARTGRSIGHRILGWRTVETATGWPAPLHRLGSTTTADVRRGRDPVRLVPQAVAAAPTQSDQWQLTASRALHAPIVLVLDNGMAFTLVGPTVIGRNPTRVDESATLLQIPDLTRTMSKSHALLEPQGGMLWVTDLGSMNGTAVAADGGGLEPIAPHVRTVVRSGSTLEFGDRLATVGTAGRAARPAAEPQTDRAPEGAAR